MALLRYPGSKERLIEEVTSRFPETPGRTLWSCWKADEYREPFFGAGGVGFDVLKLLPRSCAVRLNDIDPGIVALWQAVKDSHGLLIERIESFEPTPEAFYLFKEEDGRDGLGAFESGFRKLALHRMSFSGLGAKATGPIGGKDQSSAYAVGCRWNPGAMAREIKVLHRRMSAFHRIEITCGDFGPTIEGAPESCFIYADPPYYKEGARLYKHSMTEADHARLAGLLKDCRASWVLSYDDHPTVRDLYSWAAIEEVKTAYTAANYSSGKRPRRGELIITPIGQTASMLSAVG